MVLNMPRLDPVLAEFGHMDATARPSWFTAKDVISVPKLRRYLRLDMLNNRLGQYAVLCLPNAASRSAC